MPSWLRPPRVPVRVRVRALALALLAAAGLLPSVHAHALDLFVSTDGSLIEGMAYFSDGGRPRGALAELFVDGERVAASETDTDGRFTFELPAASADVRVSVDVGDGHRASWRLRPDQLPRGPLPEPVASADATAPQQQNAAPSHPGADADPARTTSNTELAAAIAEAVDERIAQQLAGLREELAIDARRRRVSDVLGGIGYILGLMGLATYLLRRKG